MTEQFPIADSFEHEALEGNVIGEYKAPEGNNVVPVMLDNRPDWPFKLTNKGVHYRVEKEDDDGKKAVEWKWVCGQLEIVADTHDRVSENWGRLLVVTDGAGIRHEWPMPMEMLSSTGEEIRKRLLSFGLLIASTSTARNKLNDYIAMASPKARYRCVDRIGWYDGKFVLPDVTFGDTEEERVIYQTTGSLEHAYRTSGSLDEWKEQIAAPATGNSRLAFALSCAFAGPLLGLVGEEGGGFHLRGSSSIGKSTALVVAGSVWGGGDNGGFIRQWRATDNALEAVALKHNDTLLCLDELGQVGGKVAGETAYMLANGAGKLRANRSGKARDVANWRVLFLSTGEIGIPDKIAEDGHGRKVKAGQEVRVVDIPADTGGDYRLFEDIHEHKDGDEFARALKKASTQFHGIAGQEFLIEIVRYRELVIQSVKIYQSKFMAEATPPSADGQVTRVLSRFAIVAAAGELATELGILPWRPGDASQAVKRCFEDWLLARGGSEATEVRQAISQVRLFIENYGLSRFELWTGSGFPIRDRVGYRKQNKEPSSSDTSAEDYYFMSEAFKTDVCKGLDPGMVIRALKDKGYLITKDDGKSQTTHKPPAHGRTIKLYHVSGNIVGGDAHD